MLPYLIPFLEKLENRWIHWIRQPAGSWLAHGDMAWVGKIPSRVTERRERKRRKVRWKKGKKGRREGKGRRTNIAV